MRTTLDVNDELLKQAKAFAAQSGRTLTSVVEEGLRTVVTRPAGKRAKKKRVRLPVYGSGGPVPGLDLSDNAAVRAFLDEGLPIEKLR